MERLVVHCTKVIHFHQRFCILFSHRIWRICFSFSSLRGLFRGDLVYGLFRYIVNGWNYTVLSGEAEEDHDTTTVNYWAVSVYIADVSLTDSSHSQVTGCHSCTFLVILRLISTSVGRYVSFVSDWSRNFLYVYVLRWSLNLTDI
jgi:hypothetical protein